MCKCSWCLDGGAMEAYHDDEWGIPLHDDKKQFEFLMLEAMQCGLSWSLMIKKREIFRQCFDDFDYIKIADYNEDDVQRILNYPNMIRSERKIRAVISNAESFIKIINDYGSFDKFLWDFTANKTYVYNSHIEVPAASNELSDKISAELKKRGFKYIGTVTVYSHLQACGMINDHEIDCPMRQMLIEKYPTKFID